MAPKVNIFSSDAKQLKYSQQLFEEQGYEVSTFSEFNPAITSAICSIQPDIILMDLFVENSDGIELCHHLKSEKEINAYLVFYTTKLADYILVEAYKAGADDCITRPISDHVLIRKIEALLKRKRSKNSRADILNHNEIYIDPEAYQVRKSGQEVFLPKKEFQLLLLLMKQRDNVLSRKEIYHSIWGKEGHSEYRIIDVHIRKIREKLGAEIIKTIKGKGYKLA